LGGWTAFDQPPMLNLGMFFKMIKNGNEGVGWRAAPSGHRNAMVLPFFCGQAFLSRRSAFLTQYAIRNTNRASRIILLPKEIGQPDTNGHKRSHTPPKMLITPVVSRQTNFEL
jgi:hypothetical protein